VLLCSAYKFYGPHLALIYIKEELVEKLEFYNVGADDISQGIINFQFGTPPFELICGVVAAVEYIAGVGEKYTGHFEAELKGLTGRRRNIVAGLTAFETYVAPLAKYMRDEFRKLPGVTVYGPHEGEPRTATVVITVDGKHSNDVCRILNDNGIYAWDGHFYAVVVVDEVFGLKEKGGLIRFGLAPYNTKEDIERTVKVITEIAGG